MRHEKTSSDNKDLQLIYVSYNAGLSSGQDRLPSSLRGSKWASISSWLNGITLNKTGYIEEIAQEVVTKIGKHPHTLISLAIQEHGGFFWHSFQTLLLNKINEQLELANQGPSNTIQYTFAPSSDSTSNTPTSWFRAPTKWWAPFGWQGSFLLTPTAMQKQVSEPTFTHHRAPYNKSKGCVTTACTITHQNQAIPLTLISGHLSSDKELGYSQRNYEIDQAAAEFSKNQYHNFTALSDIADKHRYRILGGDLNFRDRKPVSPETDDRDSNNLSPLKDENFYREHIPALARLQFTPCKPEGTSYHSKKEGLKRNRAASKTTPEEMSEEIPDSNDTQSDTGSVSSACSEETNEGHLDIALTLGGNLSLIKASTTEQPKTTGRIKPPVSTTGFDDYNATYVKESDNTANPSDHDALVVNYTITLPPQQSLFYTVRAMMISQLSDFSDDATRYLESLSETQENQTKMAVVFHLYRSIQDIKSQEKLLEVFLNEQTAAQNKKTNKNNQLGFFQKVYNGLCTTISCFTPCTEQPQQSLTHQSLPEKYKIADILKEQVNDYFKGNKGKGEGEPQSISGLIDSLNSKKASKASEHPWGAGTLSCWSRIKRIFAKDTRKQWEFEKALQDTNIATLTNDSLTLHGLFQPTPTVSSKQPPTADSPREIPHNKGPCSIS